jgi:predicted dehydrogenase
VIGSSGTMLYEHDKAPTGQRVKAGSKPSFHSELEDVTTAPSKPAGGEGIAGALNEFIDALASKGKQRPQCLLPDNYKSLAMVFAAIESSRTGKRVKVKG